MTVFFGGNMMHNRSCLLVILMLVGSLAPRTRAASDTKSLNDLTGPWQLMVDDYCVAEKTNVVRTYHPFEKHPGNPVLTYDRPWEGTNIYLYGTVLPDESGRGFRMWYHALPGDGDAYRLLYATSDDGIKWHKPNLGVVEYKGSKNNNIFIRRGKRDHIPSVIHTPWEKDPGRRYKMINFDGDPAKNGYVCAFSPDGLHWTDASAKPVFSKGGDVSQFLWDPHAGQYLGFVKNNVNVSGMRRRAVARTASKNILSWADPQLVLVPDTFDDRWAKGIQRTHFYGLSAFAYESMYLGFLWVFRATDDEGYFDGPVHLELVTSRDGVRWFREEGERPPILELGKDGTWDDGMHYTPQHPLLVDGKLWLYYGGFDCTHAAPAPWHGSIGLAMLRKDGFASLDAGEKTGIILTKKLAKTAGPLRLNYQCRAGGSIRVETLDAEGKPLSGYTRDDCKPLTGDNLDQTVTWNNRSELPVADAPIRLRFVMENASLYSFTAGPKLQIVDEAAGPTLAVLYTFEDGWGDSLTQDGKQPAVQHGEIRPKADPELAAFGSAGCPLGSTWCPLNTIEIKGTRNLGTQFTLALMAKNKESKPARLFSSAADHGPVKTTELVFDCDPKGQVIPGLRLICKGITVESKPLRFADGKYHHLAVTCDDGQIAFYLDGAPAGSGRVPAGEPISMTRNLFVGEDADHGREEQLRGSVDDILVLGQVLSALEIKTISQKGAEAVLQSRDRGSKDNR